MILKKGKADVITYFNLVDSAAGTPETALTITNIDATYTRAQEAAVKNDLTALAAVTTAHTDNKGIEVDATNAPGLYRVDWPDAAFATGVDRVILTVTCTGCAPAHLIVELVNYDPTDGVRMGLTALPNAAADAGGGLPISDAGGLDLDAKLANTNEITVARMGALTDWINGGRLDLLLDAVLADTAELQTDWVNGGRLDLLIDAILADTNELQTDWVNGGRLDLLLDLAAATLTAAGVRTALGLASNNLDTQIATLATAAGLTAVETAILLSCGGLAAQLSTISGNVSLALADTNELQVDWANGGRLDLLLDLAAATLTAVAARSALGLASANLDTQLLAIVARLPIRITKNTQFANFPIVLVLASDHVTGATGKTVTATRSIDGGAFAACANAVSEVGSGLYKITLATTDVNGDSITLKFTATDCDTRFITIITQP